MYLSESGSQATSSSLEAINVIKANSIHYKPINTNVIEAVVEQLITEFPTSTHAKHQILAFVMLLLLPLPQVCQRHKLLSRNIFLKFKALIKSYSYVRTIRLAQNKVINTLFRSILHHPRLD